MSKSTEVLVTSGPDNLPRIHISMSVRNAQLIAEGHKNLTDCLMEDLIKASDYAVNLIEKTKVD